jgi:hypothetical protein
MGDGPLKKRAYRKRTGSAVAELGDPPYICQFPDCGRSFSTVRAFKDHTGPPHGIRSFACPFPGCGSTYEMRNGLQTHIRNKHPNLAPGRPDDYASRMSDAEYALRGGPVTLQSTNPMMGDEVNFSFLSYLLFFLLHFSCNLILISSRKSRKFLLGPQSVTFCVTEICSKVAVLWSTSIRVQFLGLIKKVVSRSCTMDVEWTRAVTFSSAGFFDRAKTTLTSTPHNHIVGQSSIAWLAWRHLTIPRQRTWLRTSSFGLATTDFSCVIAVAQRDVSATSTVSLARPRTILPMTTSITFCVM